MASSWQILYDKLIAQWVPPEVALEALKKRWISIWDTNTWTVPPIGSWTVPPIYTGQRSPITGFDIPLPDVEWKEPEVVFADNTAGRFAQWTSNLANLAHLTWRWSIFKWLRVVANVTWKAIPKAVWFVWKVAWPITAWWIASYQMWQDYKYWKLKQTWEKWKDYFRRLWSYFDNVLMWAPWLIPWVKKTLYNTPDERTRIFLEQRELNKRWLGSLKKVKAVEKTLPSNNNMAGYGEAMRWIITAEKKNNPSFNANDFNKWYVWNDKEKIFKRK